MFSKSRRGVGLTMLGSAGAENSGTGMAAGNTRGVFGP